MEDTTDKVRLIRKENEEEGDDDGASAGTMEIAWDDFLLEEQKT